MTSFIVALDGKEDRIQNAGQLAFELRKYAALRLQRPFVAQLKGISGSLAFGIGQDQTVLSHIPLNGDPPYHESRGNAKRDGVVVYFFDESWTEFGGDAMISWQLAIEALMEFYETGQLSQKVKWAEI